MSDICNDVGCAYDGWACSVEVHEFTWEASSRSSKYSFFSLKFLAMCLLLDHS